MQKRQMFCNHYNIFQVELRSIYWRFMHTKKKFWQKFLENLISMLKELNTQQQNV